MKNKSEESLNKRPKLQSKRMKRQKRIITLLLIMFVLVSTLQIQALFSNKEKDDNIIIYTALAFDEPIKQTLTILTLEEGSHKKLFNNENNTIEYSDIKNYREENLDRYRAFHTLNPDLLESEVIWRVNTYFDLEFYSKLLLNEDESSYTAIVNKNFGLTDYYVPSDLVLLENVSSELYVRDAVNKSFVKMFEEIKKEEIFVDVSKAYLSHETITSDFNAYTSTYGEERADADLLRPGHDDHQSGLSIDLINDGEKNFSESDLYFWLKDNAHRFGFILRQDNHNDITGFNKESNHLRYVGVDLAVDMYEKNVTLLEEYLDKYGIE